MRGGGMREGGIDGWTEGRRRGGYRREVRKRREGRRGRGETEKMKMET